MPFIGNQISTSFQNVETQTITGDGSTGYTLNNAVADGKDLLVYINNVKQEEGSGKSYTASGTTITFSDAVASTDSCYVVFIGQAVGTVTPKDGSIVSSMLANQNLEMPNTLDLNGKELILDADADTSITADTDDTIDIKIAGSDVYQITATKVDLNGKELVLDADGDTSITADTDDQIDFKTGGTDRVVINSAGAVSIGTTSNPNNAPLLIACASDDNIRIKQETHASIQAVNDAANAFVALKIDGNDLLLNSQSGGNVGIGNSDPSAGGLVITSSSDGGFGGSMILENSNGSDTDKVAIALRPNGSATTALGSYGEIRIIGEYDSGSTDGASNLQFHTHSGSGTVAERIRITSSGRVGIGISSPSSGNGGGLHLDLPGNGSEAGAHMRIGSNVGYSGFHWLDGSAYYIGQNSQARAVRIYSGAETAGVALTNGQTSFGTFSDERLKYDVEDIQNAVDMISNFRTVKYRLNGVDDPNSKKKIGLVAQDLVGVLDEVIEPMKIKDDETEYMTVRYTEIVPVLVKAIQELEARIAVLEAK
tara:strand:- start:30 stop:1646 length:1617 start_codon:yes stop_codon:yes gene_type:complete